ncbi:hypothetical protein [Terrisporobacter sp.]|uniref:hypothetical protein n=1 Tax=Terrisporobacter sp. TaxID=1965305 RepID=UPI0026266C71|nr:hypothetical protein [Terrisporobacter sp.]
MTLEMPLNHSCQIKCPSCEYKYLYNFKIQDIEKINSKEKEEGNEIKYKFTTYLICKNPLCNYDIEVIGNIFEYPINILKAVNITNLK